MAHTAKGRGAWSRALADPVTWVLLVLGALAVFAHATHPPDRFTRGGLPHGDGHYHYAQVCSLVLDGDLRLANEYARLGNPHRQPMHDDGWAGNHFTIGTAVLWAPGFAIAQGGATVGTRLGMWSDPGAGRGRGVQWVTMLGGVALGWLALVLIARTLRRWFSPTVVGLSVVLTAVATPLWWYTTRQPSASHAASAFAVAGLVCAATAGPLVGGRRGAVVGAWLGLVALVRPQDVVIAAVLVPLFVGQWRAGARRATVVGVAATLVSAALVFSPQLWVWQQTYGTAWAVPQGPGFLRWGESQWASVLWSSRGGLLPWSPIVALAFGGLALGAWRGRPLARGGLVAFALAVFVCGAVDDWWGGWSFGARRLSSMSVVLAVGFAVAIEAWLGETAAVRRRAWGRRIGLAVLAIGATRFSMQAQDDYLWARVKRGTPQAMAPLWSRAFFVPLDGVFSSIGTPGSWPASWWFAARTGAAPGRYDEAVGWALVRARGDHKGYERLWLHDDRWALDGFASSPVDVRARGRTIEADEATVGLPLRTALVLGGRVRVRAEAAGILRVTGFGEPQILELRPGVHDYPLPPRWLSAGYHVLRLRPDEGSAVGVVFVDVFERGYDPMIPMTPMAQ